MKKCRLGVVILNYNDFPSVLKLYRRIKEYSVFERIIIVDGASTDDSYKHLLTLSGSHTTVLRAEKNGGYGYGNNIGLHYCQNLGLTHVLIANPDVDFAQEAIGSCMNLISQYDQAVAVAPYMKNGVSAYRFASVMADIASNILIFDKLFSPRQYNRQYFINKSFCQVDVLPGSLVLFDLEKFAECGFYDENIFLYHEEIVIGQKFRKKGYISLLNLQVGYQHFHSISVRKNFRSLVKIKQINLQSHAYYLKKYLNVSSWKMLVFICLKPLMYIEIFLWNQIKFWLQKLNNL